MKHWMQSVYGGFRDIGVVGDSRSTWRLLSLLPSIDRETLTCLDKADFAKDVVGVDPKDLLIIDLDAFSVEKTRFLLFLSSCFIPQTPLVLLTEQCLSASMRDQLNTPQVLGIIEPKRAMGDLCIIDYA